MFIFNDKILTDWPDMLEQRFGFDSVFIEEVGAALETLFRRSLNGANRHVGEATIHLYLKGEDAKTGLPHDALAVARLLFAIYRIGRNRAANDFVDEGIPVKPPRPVHIKRPLAEVIPLRRGAR